MTGGSFSFRIEHTPLRSTYFAQGRIEDGSFSWRDHNWWQQRRLEQHSTSAFAGRTGTRACVGGVGTRWQEALAKL